MVIFNSYVKLPEGICADLFPPSVVWWVWWVTIQIFFGSWKTSTTEPLLQFGEIAAVCSTCDGATRAVVYILFEIHLKTLKALTRCFTWNAVWLFVCRKSSHQGNLAECMWLNQQTWHWRILVFWMFMSPINENCPLPSRGRRRVQFFVPASSCPSIACDDISIFVIFIIHMIPSGELT